MNPSLVSVIIPVYNGEKHLRQSVDSVLSQSYEKIEVIIVDDCSTDNTRCVIREILESDARCRALFGSTNVGAGECRNWAIREARGEFLLFVDADDYVHPQLCELTCQIAHKENADVVEFGFILGQYKDDIFQYYPSFEFMYQVYKGEDITRHINKFDAISCNKLFRKQHVINSNLSYRGRVYEDTYFSRESILTSRVSVLLREPLYLYYERLDSNVRSFSINKVLPLFQRDMEVDQLYQKHHVPFVAVLVRRVRADIFSLNQLVNIPLIEYKSLRSLPIRSFIRIRYILFFCLVGVGLIKFARFYLYLNLYFLKVINKMLKTLEL